MIKTDTIAAIATALSDSGIGIIRVSGEEAFKVVNKIFRNKFSSICPYLVFIPIKTLLV